MQTLDADGARSFGSGAAIAYHGRIVVFTASHVVRDARRVWVRDTAGRWHAAGVVARSEWDVALLQPFGEGPFVPAKLAYRASESDAAGTVFRPGDRLDSCGFGPDDRLAVNHGTFLRYARRNPADTVTDWLVLTGAARQGDSGGPVFNSRGELVGILWGTDGRTVVATQCGRLHVVLREAMGDEGREAGDEESVTGNRAASCDLNSGGPRSVVAANDHTNNNGSSTNRLVPVSYPTVAPLGESRLLEHGDGRGLLPLCKPRETRPAPQVIIQADPNLRDINRKMDTVIVNTTPPAPDTDDASQEATSPVVLALVIGGAVVIGFVVYFGTQGRD